MLGFPEALQQHSPRVLAAVPEPRVQNPADEGVRGRRLGSLGSPGEPEACAHFGTVGAPSYSTREKKLQRGPPRSLLCVCEYACA